MPRTPRLDGASTALAIAGLCLVAACGRNTAGNTTAAGAPAASATAQASGPDQVIDVSQLPHPRAGLWRMTLDDGDGKPDTTTSCLSGKAPVMKMPKNCSQFTIKRTFLGAIVMDMKCASPDYSITMHSVATGDFQSGMSSDAVSTITMKGQPGPRTTRMHTEAHYAGPCPAGQTPDDATDTAPSAPG